MSEITKKSLANALYQKMKVKPLDKITIKEIVDECGLNRQTFYYHFPDIFGLLEWMFQQDAEKLMKKYNNIDVWEQGFMELLCYIRKIKQFACVHCILWQEMNWNGLFTKMYTS